MAASFNVLNPPACSPSERGKVCETGKKQGSDWRISAAVVDGSESQTVLVAERSGSREGTKAELWCGLIKLVPVSVLSSI